MRRWLLGAAVAVGLTAPLAYAQSVIYQDLSGSECWNAGQGPGGPSQFLCSDVLRNSSQVVAGALSGSLTYGTGSLATLRYGGNLLFTTQPVALTTLITPPNPVQDGAIIGFCNVTGSNFATTSIAVTTSLAQTLNTSVSVTTLGANACKYLQFNRPNTTWYVIQ